MTKKILLIFGLISTISCVYAAESTIYTDDIGRMHFMGKEAGYSGMPAMRGQQAQTKMINETAKEFSKEQQQEFSRQKEELSRQQKEVIQEQQNYTNKTQRNILDVIEESKGTTPKSQHKSVYTGEKEALDASNPYGYSTNIKNGVNDAKTIYTDDIGRLHFFGKDSKVKN